MKFREWIRMHEAGRVFSRTPGVSHNRYSQHNNDLPLNKVLPAVGRGLADSLMQSQQKSGAEFHGTPSLRLGGGDDGMEGGGEILNPQGVTHASLPLQMNKIMHNGSEMEPAFSLKNMRTIDKIDGDPATDGLYIKYDQGKGHSLSDAVEHTTKLADEKLKELMTMSGEINKVDPKPVLKQAKPNSQGVLEIVYQFKPKKGGK